jgi:hypothetical protein
MRLKEYTINKERAQILYKQIKEVTSLDILKHTRKVEYVEARALFNFILYNTYGWSLHKIATFYNENGKKYDHSTVLHSLRTFDVYRKYSVNLDNWLEDIEKTELGEKTKQDLANKFVSNLNTDKVELAYNFLKSLYNQQQQENDYKNTDRQD